VATEAKPGLTLRALDKPPAESYLRPDKADLEDLGRFQMRSSWSGSFRSYTSIFRLEAFGHALKELMDTPAKDEDESSKGSAQ
jgi:hypothetical protein